MRSIIEQPNENSKVKMVGYFHEINKKQMPNHLSRPCIVICPGGACIRHPAKGAGPPTFYGIPLMTKAYRLKILCFFYGGHTKVAHFLRMLHLPKRSAQPFHV